MLLPIRSQGFPNLITQLGIQSPLQGPFWNFESTVLPTIDVRSLRNEPTTGMAVMDAFASAGQLATPIAGDFLATFGPLLIGAWALRFQWAWVNQSAGNAFLAFQRLNDTFTVVLQEDIIETIGGSTLAQRQVGANHLDLVLQNTFSDQPYGLRILQGLATAGSVVVGSVRGRFLGTVGDPSGFNP